MLKIKMGKVAELRPGQALEKRILTRRVAVFNIDGKLYGLEADCKHMKASLAQGEVHDGILTCRWHGWKYDLESGECLTQPGMKLKRYDIVIDDDEIYVLFP